ncbi:uncharacterized protein N0V96_011149 [Colletotrichum fioriniae]|uniref:uncharacterized protein n=1 Tax=Colletotrichum fioriniae TaxID=710243 RepID=UPI0032D9D001|nr:hypothetical protein N0V96_011149 [Colletotrichum fioriniae]
MPGYQRPSTPLSAPISPVQQSFQDKSQQDTIKQKNSSIFLNVPQAFSAGGIITPPETPAQKQQHATSESYATLIDCPISKSSFLLAQASLATALAGRTSSSTEFKFRDPEAFGAEAGTETRTRTLRFGTGLDGCFTSARGFLGCQAMPPTNVINLSISNSVRSLGQTQRLPASLKAWEVVHGNLPRLLRARRVRHAVDALREHAASGGRDAWDDLEQRHLARAALVLSALAHAYMFGEEQNKSKECEGRSQVPADDVLNNAMGNAAFNLSSAYFGLPEERLSSGLQGTMEGIFAPALSAMALAQSGVLADQPDQVTHCLESLAANIVQCANVFEAMTLRDAAIFDPVVWIKTYPAMGRAVTPGELGNSGADTPLFHALDVFIGRQDVKGDLTAMQSDRKATLPANIRAFLDALGDRAASVRDYVAACAARAPKDVSSEEQSQYRHLEAAWDGLLQMYVWFLERHRVKAIGVTGVSLNTGRHSTSSGVKSTDQCKHAGSSSASTGKGKGKPKMRPEAMLSMQMKAGMASRLGGRPLWQNARIQSQTVYEGSTVVEVKLDAKLPLEAGDRVQVWPPRKRRNLDRTSSHQRWLRASTPPEDHDALSDETVEDGNDDADPRFYSIARVATDSAGEGGMTITLTVSQHSPEGLVSSFLSNAAQGTPLRLRPWPSLRFRQPHDLSVPLVLVGQGSGIGPLLGFLHERSAWAQQRRDGTDDVGELLLVVAAKTRRHVPCPLDSLEHLTRVLPLTVVLALSQETHHFRIRGGIRSQLSEGERHVRRHLVEHRDSIHHLVKDEGGHVFVCGSSDFGATVTNSLELGQPQPEDQDINCFDDNNYTDILSPPAHWDRLHQDLFTAVKRPFKSQAPSSSSTTSSSLPIITPSELAAHNSITSSWAAIDGKVYDLTPFLTIHPGGPKTLLESAGTIADVRFAETHGGPHAQEIRGYLQQYAIGRLPPPKCPRDLITVQVTTARLTDALVRMQNALTNNTAFDPSRGSVPVYVYEDALLVFADGLDGVMAILSDVVASDATGDTSELRETVANTQALLRKAFSDLKDGCKRYMQAAGSNGSDSLLDESEGLIQRLHKDPITKIHEAINACKKGLGEFECLASEEGNGSVKICDILEEFTTTLTSLAQNLLRVIALAEETGTADLEQRTTCREENIYATHSAMPSVDL